MSFYVNVSSSSEFRDGSNVYPTLWKYIHLMRASTRVDIQARIRAANRMPVIASLADSVRDNKNWNTNGERIVTSAIEKYYKLHASELEDLVKKASAGAHVECCMVDRYLTGKPHDFIGGVIRKLIESHSKFASVANSVSSTSKEKQDKFNILIDRTIPEQKGDGKDPEPDATVVHFNPKPEEPSVSTDDETFKQLNRAFWRSQNDKRLESIVRRKETPSETVNKMRERVQTLAKQQEKGFKEPVVDNAATAKAAADKLAADNLAAAADKHAADELAASKAASDKLAADNLAADKIAAAKAAADKLAAAKAAADKAAADKLAADKAAADKLAADKLAADKLAANNAAADKLAADKLAADKAASDKLAADKAAADKLAANIVDKAAAAANVVADNAKAVSRAATMKAIAEKKAANKAAAEKKAAVNKAIADAKKAAKEKAKEKVKEKAKEKAEEKKVGLSISSSTTIPSGTELVISTENTGSSVETGDVKSIYMPIDRNTGFTDDTASAFFNTLFALSKAKKVHVYAILSVAPFIRDVIVAAGHDIDHDIVDDNMDADLKEQLPSIIKSITS